MIQQLEQATLGVAILEQPDAIQLFRKKTILRMLKLELDTGMRHSTNTVFKAAKAITGCKTRKTAYKALERIVKEGEALLGAVKES